MCCGIDMGYHVTKSAVRRQRLPGLLGAVVHQKVAREPAVAILANKRPHSSHSRQNPNNFYEAPKVQHLRPVRGNGRLRQTKSSA